MCTTSFLSENNKTSFGSGKHTTNCKHVKVIIWQLPIGISCLEKYKHTCCNLIRSNRSILDCRSYCTGSIIPFSGTVMKYHTPLVPTIFVPYKFVIFFGACWKNSSPVHLDFSVYANPGHKDNRTKIKLFSWFCFWAVFVNVGGFLFISVRRFRRSVDDDSSVAFVGRTMTLSVIIVIIFLIHHSILLQTKTTGVVRNNLFPVVYFYQQTGAYFSLFKLLVKLLA